LPGVRHFIDHTCVPGVNSWVPWSEAEEIFSSGKIHYTGQCIGLILADTPDLAHKAVQLVKVTYKNKKPIVSNIRDAMKDPARVVQELPDFFGFCPKQVRVGDTAEQVKRDDLTTIEGEFEMGSQYHFYMETLTALCRPVEDNQIQLYASTQWMDFSQNLVAAALGIQKNHIDMQVRRLGGGYGGKATPAFFVAVASAVACWKINKPVRIVMDLKTNMTFTGMREPYVAKYKAGVDKDGLLQFVETKMYAETGWNASECLSLAEAVPFAQNAYHATTWDMTPIGVVTDKPRNTACRAPGTTQVPNNFNEFKCFLIQSCNLGACNHGKYYGTYGQQTWYGPYGVQDEKFPQGW
jgi:xanthine dehydrogenase/oxidase